MDRDIDLGIDQLTDAEVIGRGGFSTVYAATDTQFDRRVAVKVLRKLVKDSDRARFERECRVMGRLSSHPSVVTIYHAGYTDSDEPYLTMELNEGGSLADRMAAEGRIGWRQAVEFMIPIADALHHAHTAGILHRDVKPENILLGAGVPRLTDFGIAYLRDSAGATSTSISASWLHTAPETFDNQRDERSDIYSAGSTLYNLIAGRAPFESPTDESLNPLMRRLITAPPPPLPAGSCPPALEALVRRCLAKAPDDRPQTGAELAADLQKILDSGGALPDPSPGRPNPPASAQPPHFTAPAGPPPAEPGPVPRHQAPVPQRPLAQPGPVLHQPPARSGSIPQQPPAQPTVGPHVTATGGGGRTAAILVAAAVGVVVLAGLGIVLLRAPVDSGGGPETEAVEADLDPSTEPEPPTTEPAPEATETTELPGEGPEVIPPVFDGPATSIDELEARWAESRAAVVTALGSDAYGIGADNVLRGPGGFEVNLDNCPAGWSDTAGLDGGTIPIGQTSPITGPQSSIGTVSAGIEAYFDYVNASGGVAGLDVELVVRDDQYAASNTVAAVGELVDDENVFAVTTVGTANTLATYDELSADCVPQPFVITAHPGVGDPVNHPFTLPLMMTWGSEAVLWGNWIEENLADQLPVRVAAIISDDEFGKAYRSPFEAWVAANPGVVSDFVAVTHDPAAATLAPEMAQVAAADPQVIISMTSGAACARFVQEAGNTGLNESATALFQSSVCRDIATIMAPAGAAADGFLTLSGGLKSTVDPAVADDPYVRFVSEQITAAGLDTNNPLHGTGFGFYGWAQVEALRIAADLPGGLSRSNFILALRGLQLIHPMLHDGISFGTWGNDDAYPIEGSEVARFDAAAQTWVLGPIIDRDRQTPPCAWGFDGC